MAKPIALARGIAFAFPDACKTPPNNALIPYPNVAMLEDASSVTNESGREVLVGSGGDHVLLADAVVATSTGDEAGSAGPNTGPCKIDLASTSKSVVYGPGKIRIVRFLDQTSQNYDNATGAILSAFPTVLVGD